MIGGMIVPRCITFLTCLDWIERKQRSRWVGTANCSNVIEKHLVNVPRACTGHDLSTSAVHAHDDEPSAVRAVHRSSRAGRPN